jgi:hypothetical protein
MPTSSENQAVISRRHYEKNKADRVAVIRTVREAQVAKNKAYVAEYLKTHACVDCGATEALEFDHRDASTKRAAVSDIVTKGYSLPSVIAEIGKCDVRCRPHHLVRHYG